MTVGCEIDSCGVPPIGRCVTCGRAFCLSHQGRTSDMRLLIDQDIVCSSLAIQSDRDRSARFGRSFFSDDTARQTLRKAGVPTGDFHRVHRETQYLRFGRRKETVRVEPLGRAWLLGTYRWKYTTHGGRTGTDASDEFLTVLWDNDVPWTQRSGVGHHNPESLFAVHTDPTYGGYEHIDLLFGSIATPWETLCRRVYELAGTTP